VKGMGATLPVAPNTTNVNRAKNRRVNLILVPNI
jgi:outer membrane protein OmpA-like peptidoglycan-associated protein